MPSVGIRELKSQTSEIVRQVREERAEYIVTLRGEPVAVLLPVDKQAMEAEAIRTIQFRPHPVNVSGQTELRSKALALAGSFHAGLPDLSAEHDRYLDETFGA